MRSAASAVQVPGPQPPARLTKVPRAVAQVLAARLADGALVAHAQAPIQHPVGLRPALRHLHDGWAWRGPEHAGEAAGYHSRPRHSLACEAPEPMSPSPPLQPQHVTL